MLTVSAKSFMADDFWLRMGRLDIGERVVDDIDVKNSWVFFILLLASQDRMTFNTVGYTRGYHVATVRR